MKIYIVHYTTDEDLLLLGAYDSIDKYKNAIATSLIEREVYERIGTDQQDIKDYLQNNYFMNEINLNEDSNEFLSYYGTL